MASLIYPERSFSTLILLYLRAVLPTLVRLPARLPDSFPKGISGIVKIFSNPKAILDPQTMPEGDNLIAHLRGSMSIVAACLPILVKGDEGAKEQLSHLNSGLLHLSVPAAGVSIWIDWDGKELKSNWGNPPRQPDVILDFKTPQTAYLAFSKQLDELSAIGKGDLVVTGMLPFADGMNGVMDRVSYYLK